MQCCHSAANVTPQRAHHATAAIIVIILAEA
jgi:hypothetical protein